MLVASDVMKLQTAQTSIQWREPVVARQLKRLRAPLSESFVAADLVVGLPLRPVLEAAQALEEARAHEEAQTKEADLLHLEVALAAARSLQTQAALAAAQAAAHAQQLH